MGRIIPYIMENKKCLKPPTNPIKVTKKHSHFPKLACRGHHSIPFPRSQRRNQACPNPSNKVSWTWAPKTKGCGYLQRTMVKSLTWRKSDLDIMLMRMRIRMRMRMTMMRMMMRMRRRGDADENNEEHLRKDNCVFTCGRNNIPQMVSKLLAHGFVSEP